MMIEPMPSVRFAVQMDKAMPKWRCRRDLLNELPHSHFELES